MRNAILLFVVLTSSIGCDIGGPEKLREKLVCDANTAGQGSFELRMTEEQATQWGEAFSAEGNCDATLHNSTFISPGTALRAGGNTKLVFEGGRIEGNPALDVSGNAKIELKGTVVVGEVKTSANGKVIGLDAPAKL
jgi:hypothetical protein